MIDDPPSCRYVIDCEGLHELSITTSNTIRVIVLDYLRKGYVAVPSCVWHEFEALYEEEAASIKKDIILKISLKKIYNVGAARIAEKLNSGFSRGPYDNHTLLYTTSIASVEGYQVLTSSSNLRDYKKMECEAIDLATFAADKVAI